MKTRKLDETNEDVKALAMAKPKIIYRKFAENIATDDEEEFSTLPKYGEGKYTPRFRAPQTVFEEYLRAGTTRREPVFATSSRRIMGNNPNISPALWEDFQPDQLFPEGSREARVG